MRTVLLIQTCTLALLSQSRGYISFPGTESLLARMQLHFDGLLTEDLGTFAKRIRNFSPEGFPTELERLKSLLPLGSDLKFPDSVGDMLTDASKSVAQLETALDAAILEAGKVSGSDLSPILGVISHMRDLHFFDVGFVAIASAVILTLLIGNVDFKKSDGIIASDDDSPYGSSGVYNSEAAANFFSKRPLVVFQRSLEIAIRSSSLGLGLLVDFLTDKLTDKDQEKQRAEQLTDTLTQLGPTFIKVGQSLSIRTDLLRPAYIQALTQLQDKVPPFPTVQAREIIQQELGKPIEQIFDAGLEPTATVVAAASLGQVYKAKLKSDGSEVAVKVQRPNIIESVALDMHLLRSFAKVAKVVARLQTDVAGVVDDWGRGFVDELNYFKEADNAETFMREIAKTPLRGAVLAPPVLKDVSSRRVLTTKWIDGEKLDSSKSDDIVQLCSIAMNTYLTMMLDMPILHCDPHPGNLKRTPDGRLCILDWGLVTTLQPDLQLSYIEHIAHLTSRDYAKVPMDLVKLGFVPEGMEKAALEQGVVDVLTDVYTQFGQGGGAAKIDVNGVINSMNGLAEKYGRIFQLPPYFAYIARAFGVLEGIGLSYDPDYAIVGECLPYISQRLLTDASARTGGALGTFIFGADKDKEDRLIDADRMELLLSGFSSYTKATGGVEALTQTTAQTTGTAPAFSVSSNNNERRKASINAATKIEKAATQIVDLLLARTDNSVGDAEIADYLKDNQNSFYGSEATPGSSRILPRGQLFPRSLRESSLTPLQQLILEELGKVLGAGLRSSWKLLRTASGVLPSGRTVLGTALDPLGLFKGSGLVEVDDFDERTLEAARRLVTVLRRISPAQQLLSELTPSEIRQVAQAVARRLWDRREGLVVLGAQLAGVMLLQTAKRLERPRAEKQSNVGVGVRSTTTNPTTNSVSSTPMSSTRMESSSSSSSLLTPVSTTLSSSSPGPGGLRSASSEVVDLTAGARLSSEESSRLSRARYLVQSISGGAYETIEE